MSDKPIIFSAGMVRAVLDGRKSQTRRVPAKLYNGAWCLDPDEEDEDKQKLIEACPYGKAGDRLWVKETWQTWMLPNGDLKCFYRANGEHQFVFERDEYDGFRKFYTDGFQFSDEFCPERRWRSSRIMPRQHSRITLEIVSVRVEHVQDITEADARAEGVAPNWVGDLAGWSPEEHGYLDYLLPESRWDSEEAGLLTARESYQTLWDLLNRTRGYGWDANPWVWVLEFRRVES
jgi:hypothetical protein